MRAFQILLSLLTAAVSAELVTETQATGYWYENIKRTSTGSSSSGFRNVKAFGAKGDGIADDSAAIQKAINTGGSGTVYLPAGTYLVNSAIKNVQGVVIAGDPTSRPMIKASASFKNAILVVGQDSRVAGLGAFYHGVKNLVLDSRAVPSAKSLTLLQFSVSQNSQLSNVMFDMPIGSEHIGVETGGQVMPLLMNELQFFGGAIGYRAVALQVHLKNWYFKNVATGIKVGDTLISTTAQGLRFEGSKIGIDATSGGMGHFNLIDATASNTSSFFRVSASTTLQGSMVLENVIVDSSVPETVSIAGKTALTGSVEPGSTWIRGNVYGGEGVSAAADRANGTKYPTSRPAALANSTGFYYTVAPPNYEDFDASKVLNIRDVSGYRVAGDGTTDDTASIQAIITAAAGKQIVFFPHGNYLISNTIHVPPGTRLVGEAWIVLVASGNNFKDSKNPRPLIEVGKPGDVGLAQMSDFILTVNDILPGLIFIQVNMAGDKPGNVGFFNTHFTATGSGSSTGRNSARVCAHFTPTSSAYFENSWVTGFGSSSAPGAAGGFLVEALNGTWLLGIGTEHHVLYQVNIHKASNVFLGLEQGEAPYWQGTGNTVLAPAPLADSLLPSDPDFSWCHANDALCRMALYQRVSGSSNINLYGGAFWNFRAGPSQALCSGDCQTNAVLYENNTKLFSYGISTINAKNLIMETGPGGNRNAIVASRTSNQGTGLAGFTQNVPAYVAAYLRQSK